LANSSQHGWSPDNLQEQDARMLIRFGPTSRSTISEVKPEIINAQSLEFGDASTEYSGAVLASTLQWF
jgi:hypothetical protein